MPKRAILRSPTSNRFSQSQREFDTDEDVSTESESAPSVVVFSTGRA